jgi:cellulose biosynthesis protein BcsQ
MNTESVIALCALLVTVFGGLVTAGNYLVQKYLDKSRRKLRNQLQEYQAIAPTPDIVTKLYDDNKILNAAKSAGENKITQLTHDVQKRDAEIKQLTAQNTAYAAQMDSLNAQVIQITQERDSALSSLKVAVGKLEEKETETAKKEKNWQGMVHKTLETEGQIWLRPVKGKKAHQPVDLPERKTPIVSILNLKGGVGKTTLTAFLGLALACRGWRVLLIDLDLQGSLSSLFLTDEELTARSDAHRALRDFLAVCSHPRPKEKAGPGAPTGPRPTIKDYVLPLPQLDGRAYLLPTTDKLAYEELNLTFEWLLKLQMKQEGQSSGQLTARHDGRLILRKALHRMKGLKKHYDIVLMDCPPIVNLSCVNALAASDYVLIPVTPSHKAVERVPSTLKRLKEMKEELNPFLDVLGVIVNRTQQAELGAQERDIVFGTSTACHGQWGKAIKFFPTSIPDRTQVRDAEEDFPPRDHGNKLVLRLCQLADEVVKEMSPLCGPSRGPWFPWEVTNPVEVSNNEGS